ncbi:plasmid stabilization protein [Niabella ginsenosidivorans]|uniref:Toxin n=1 Tax=Niabella ginsenosidivorans TaxID=1176587 RepID=A0A1A9I349_9BACT|nr:type II toxin-antitoxin system RelE/ParE family toxin [Niabella ginsenosidivorans]ANH80994.1 plasmid stabilization protein [Niabella ginsenosidivorans]
MAYYTLSNKAVEDLSNIWAYSYSYEAWSENQADKYYELLIEACRKLAENPMLGKNYEAISKDIHGFKTGKHIIFYRALKHKAIEIVRILHESMDLRNRLTE